MIGGRQTIMLLAGLWSYWLLPPSGYLPTSKQELNMTTFDGSKRVYTGKTLNGEIHVESEVGGYAPLVTMTVEQGGFNFTLNMGQCEAEELGLMISAAAAATRS